MLAPNDWEIKKFIYCVLCVLLCIIGLIGFELLGFHIPYFRNLVGFIFLTFIPGLLILRILRIHKIGIINSLLYSVALSIGFIYFTGLFANFVLPLLGILKPFSLLPIIIILTIFIIILAILAYKQDKSFFLLPVNFSIKKLPFSLYLLLLLLPLLTILGTQLVNAYHNNILLLFLLGLIACIVGLASFGYLPQEAYPLVIIIISISLMLHQSLISPTLYGPDIQIEYYLQHLVIQNGIWNWLIPHNYNTCLSIVIMAPIYSLIMSIDGIWLFKILYPMLFSLTPLALFQILRKQIGAERSFYTTFFFMTIPFLIPTMISHARQEIAEIFFVMLLMLLIDDKLSHFKKSVLSVIFYISLVFSHYALAYIAVIIFGSGYFLILLFKKLLLMQQKKPYLTELMENITHSFDAHEPLTPVLSIIPIILLFVVTISWHTYITTGSVFNNIVTIGENTYSGLAEFFLPGVRDNMIMAGLGGGFLQAPILDKVFRILQYITQLFIVVGFIANLFKSKLIKLKLEFISLSMIGILLILACVVIPRIGAQLGTDRFYHIASYLFAAFCILGGEIIWNGIVKIMKKVNLSIKPSYYFICLSLVILIPYYLFNSGFVYAFNNKHTAMDLGPYKADYYGLFNQHEMSAASWVSKGSSKNVKIYADASSRLLLYQLMFNNIYIIPSNGKISSDALIYLRNWNIKNNEILVSANQGVTHIYVPVNLLNRPELVEGFLKSPIIYTNGGSSILAWKIHV